MWADLQTEQPSRRRFRVPLIVAAALLAVAAIVALALRTREPAPRTATPTATASTVAGSAAGTSPAADFGVPATAADLGIPVDLDAGAQQAEQLLAGLRPTTVLYTFDAGPGRVLVDSRGHHTLRAVTGAGGSVAFARHGDGYAVRFPARCRQAPSACPRAILESAQPSLFNSGTRPLRYGAAVLMQPADTGPGANVLQKGFSVGGGTQFKLQIDGRAGRPSCVMAAGQTIYRLVGPVGVADGRWHRVSCTRIAGHLFINTDGRAVSRRVPAGLSIRNSAPLRIGGKGAQPNNDQFSGRIDNVFVTLY